MHQHIILKILCNKREKKWVVSYYQKASVYVWKIYSPFPKKNLVPLGWVYLIDMCWINFDRTEGPQ